MPCRGSRENPGNLLGKGLVPGCTPERAQYQRGGQGEHCQQVLAVATEYADQGIVLRGEQADIPVVMPYFVALHGNTRQQGRQ